MGQRTIHGVAQYLRDTTPPTALQPSPARRGTTLRPGLCDRCHPILHIHVIAIQRCVQNTQQTAPSLLNEKQPPWSASRIRYSKPTMPAVLHAPLTNTPGFMLKERTAEPLAPAFTAVNGRTSPPSPRKLYGMSGMNGDSIHVRPIARTSPEAPQDPKGPAAPRDEWSVVRNVTENGHQNGRAPPPALPDEDQSSAHSGKRKRSGSPEDSQSDLSPEGSLVTRPRLDSYAMVGRDESPRTVAQVQRLNLDNSQARAQLNLKDLQARALPPMASQDRPETERSWTQPHDASHNGYRDHQHHDARRMDRSHDDMNSHQNPHAQLNGSEDPNDHEHSSTTEMTRAGVQVDPKKRKRVSCRFTTCDVANHHSNSPTAPRLAVGRAAGERRSAMKPSPTVGALHEPCPT